MKGIVGKKLGMTQLFDEESGVVTSVTVIEAGPCPVVAVRTPDADGYEAVQLAWEPVADRKISKAERGHLAKNGVDGAYRHLVEFRGHFADAVQGENVTVEIFEPGDKVKVAGIGDRQGLPGHDQAPQLLAAAPSRTARTTSASRARSAPSATPSRVFKGIKMAGRMGGKRVTQARAHRPLGRRRAEPPARQGRRAGPEERAGRDPETCADGRAEGTASWTARSKDVSLDEAVFGAEVKPHLVHEAVRAELNARAQGTRAAKSRGLVAGGRAKPWRQKGTGRARQGTIRAPQFTGGGVAFPPTPRDFSRQGEQQGARRPRCARALSDHAQAGTLGLIDAAEFDGAVDAAGRRAARRAGARRRRP